MNAPLLPGRIEHWPLARPRPYARNAKTHDRRGTHRAALLRGGTGPGLLRRGDAAVGDGDGADCQPRLTSWLELANVCREGEWELGLPPSVLEWSNFPGAVDA